MKIIVSQQNKKILITFSLRINKADDFLMALDRVVKLWQRRQRRHLQGKPKFYHPVDKFIRKHKIKAESLKNTNLKFVNVGMLTERIIRSIMKGLSFDI